MKTRLILALALAFAGIQAMAQDFSKLIDRQDVYVFRSKPSDIHGRFNNPGPSFVIFPDARTTKEDAEQFIQSSGIQSIIDGYTGSVYFVNPMGAKYDNAADFNWYKSFISRLRIVTNLKVVGIGNGATFVDETIAHNACNVAGIVSINSKASAKAASGESPVPAYVIGKNAQRTAAAYIARDKAALCEKSGKTALYVNKEEDLLRLYVNAADVKDPASVIADAWDKVLSWNYRFNNTGHTWYTGESYGEHGDSELVPFVVFDRLGIKRNVVVDNIGSGEYLWYEYLPEAAQNAADGTVPLVVLLHGNNNDPRTQAETAGFLHLASQEGFMVVEMEWQGNGYAVMGHDGIESVVYELFNRYPQIDRSRVYAEGLSAGAFNATALGIKKSHLFAAVGAQSGGLFGANRFGASRGAIMDEAAQKAGAVQMPYFSISGIADEVVPFVSPMQKGPNFIHYAWQAYQLMNGLPVVETLDFSADEVFGLALENRQRVMTNKGIAYHVGDLCKDGVPLVRIVGVENYGHWNFQPGAKLMWEYFKMFSRDVNTKKLIVCPDQQK